MSILDIIPDDLKRELLDGVVHFLVGQAEKMGSDQIARSISNLSSQAAFQKAFDTSMERAIVHFSTGYMIQDEDLVIAITTDGDFWKSQDVRQRLIALIKRPGAWLADEKEAVVQHFADVLPQRVNRERVEKAVNFLLRCVVEELWTLPGAGEIREVYSLQFQKIGAEAVRQQVALMEAQLQATTQLSVELRQALLQLAMKLEQRLLMAPLPQLSSLNERPYQNLSQPDYVHFVGRRKEIDWLHQRLAPGDRAWQMVISGIGGVGKSSLALAIAHDYRKHYQELPPEERFEAIIWISAKEEVLTIKGREKFAPTGLTFRTLEDMYTKIAQTLQREDITRALQEEQDHLVQKALATQRTLLVVDNLESVTDERVKAFLRHLPAPTKCIITSREWVDVADILRLTGLPLEEAEKMIVEEANARSVILEVAQRWRLSERTSGLPLPIKLSIARMASGETFDQVMRWLGNASGDLPEYCVKGQVDFVRQRASNSWKLLLASSLFDQEAAIPREILGNVTDLPLADRDDGLASLQRLSLINKTETDRFWLLSMVQGYAGEELINTDLEHELTERWLVWLLGFAQGYSASLDLHVERTQIVSQEYPHVLRAIRWCRERQQWEHLCQLVEGIWFYPYLVGRFGELREMVEVALQAAKTLQDEQSEGRFVRRLGTLSWVQGQHKRALEYLQRAKEVALRYKDEVELGIVELECSASLTNQNHLLEAEQLAKAALEIGEKTGHLEIKFTASYRLSALKSEQQNFDEALQWADESERWGRELGWTRGLAWMMYRRGAILTQQQNFNAAEPFLQQSLDMASVWGERRLIAYNKRELAQIYLELNQLQLALQLATEARDLYERLGMNKELEEVEELLQKLPSKNMKSI